LVTLALAAWIGAACGSDAPSADLGGGCTLASDCSSPLICAFQRCHQQCDSDRDCTGGERCVRSDGDGNVCQLPGERDCERTTDCPAGQICAVDLQCRNACDGDKDCTPGEVCVDATCAKPSEVGPGGKLPQKGGADGAPCRYTSECQTPRVCTHHECVYQCVSDADCPIELRCVDNACEPVEPVCVPGQQLACEPCGIKLCDESGMWLHCSEEGCGNSGGGGSGPGSGSSSGGAGPGSGGASTTAGPGATTTGAGGASTAATSGPGSTGVGGATSSTTAATTTSGIGGATASSTSVTTSSVGGATASSSAVATTGTSCMMCLDAGLPFDGAGGDPHTRNICCP
jgi:hypothetical protein